MLAWLLLGAVQGLAEFLPISSSGHLVLLRTLLNIPGPPITLELILHLGTAVASILAYRQAWARQITALFARAPVREQADLIRLLVAVAATGLVGVVMETVARPAFSDPRQVGYGFLATSVGLALTSFRRKNERQLTLLDALLVGLVQGVAVFPGLSRSGATIATLLLLGTSAEEATRFSFMVAPPTILAATLWTLRQEALRQVNPLAAALGFAVSLCLGILAIEVTRRAVRRERLLPFALYTLLLGIWLVT